MCSNFAGLTVSSIDCPELAADLVRRRVAVIATASPPAAFAAKEASATIPIVFGMAQDPVKLGLVAGSARPGGNLTGVNFLFTELATKRLELLRETVPSAKRLAVLVNRAQATNTERTLQEVQAGAQAMGLQIRVLNVGTSREIDVAFAGLEHERPDALFVGSGTLFSGRRDPMGGASPACRQAIRIVHTSRLAG